MGVDELRKAIDELRQAIDEADQQIIAALKRRAEAARRIGELKAAEGRVAFAPDREAAIMRRLALADVAPLPNDALQAIYVEIISGCLALEQPLRVAYLGPQFTFSHQAVVARFGRSACAVPCPSVDDAINAVAAGQASLAMVPVENSTEGPVGITFDCLVDRELPVVGEFYLPVHHTLLGKGPMEGIEEVYSHPQVLAQCRRWLAHNLPTATLVPASSSAAAAQMAAESETRAAIAPAEAGHAGGLRVLAENTHDEPGNRTRFWIIGGSPPPPTGKDKTSLAIATRHRSGALHEALEPFRRHNLNMTMIHSRPMRGRTWEYLFFIDFQGHADEAAAALDGLRELCAMLKVLGSYPEAD
ncbi:MAG: prephenate dehydratase [Armatimonadetes bacterium]|nr:prephenate dehydratase [Armatimonadota bacterium]